MNVAKTIAIDLNRPKKNVVHLMQGDTTHVVDLVILKDGVPFAPEDGLTGVAKSIKYIASDGSGDENVGGVTLVTGKTNEYNVALSHGETNVPGFTEVFVVFTKNGNVLHSFPITLDVIKTDADVEPAETGLYLRKSAQAAKTSGMTQIVGVDDNGKLWVAPGGGSATLTITITQSGGTYSSDTYHSDIQSAVSDGLIVLADTPDGVGYYYDADASGSLFYVLCRIGDAMSSVEYHVTSNAVAREVFTIDNDTKLAVLYGSAMSLGASQKLQARTNIDAAEAVTVVTSSDSTATITPTANHQYVFSNPILSLEISSSYAASGDWSVEFDAPTNVAPSVTIPSALKTIPDSPTFSANHHYEINCHNGYAVVAEW